MPRLFIDTDGILKEVRKRKAKKVLLQAPAGLKRESMRIASVIERKTRASVFISADNCFGACDPPIKAINVLKPDLVIHIGHSKMLNIRNISYFPATYKFSKREIKTLVNLVEKELKKRNLKRVCGVAPIQYIELLKELRKELRKKHFTLEIKKGRLKIPGLILGCETSAAKTNASTILLLADGLFHALGVLRSQRKEVLLLNPLSKSLMELSEKDLEKFIRKRFAILSKALQAKKFGVLLCLKPGQYDERKALSAKRILEEKGKEAYILAIDDISEQALLDFGLDAYVFIACPRLIDDSMNWKKPLISFEELLEIFKRS